MYYLQGPYQGKAHKLIEEVVKARVESRYPEVERTSEKWEVRNALGDLSLFSAVTEDTGGQSMQDRGSPAKIQVMVDVSKLSHVARVGDDGVEVTVAISILENGLFLLETAGTNGYTARDKLTEVEFLQIGRAHV